LYYNIYRTTSETGNFIRIAEGIGSTDYDDETVINGVTYWYYVTAVFADPYGESLSSNIAQATPGVSGDILVIVPDVRGIPGDTVIVSIDIDNSIDVAGGDFLIHYCPEMLQALEIRSGNLTFNSFFQSQIFAGTDSLRFSFSQDVAMSGVGGTLAEIVFLVNPEALLGTTCEIIPSAASLYNLDAQPLSVGVITGIVSLGSKGDVNGDGRINAQDAILTMRMAVDDPTYFPTSYERWAAEVDGDDFADDGLPDAYDATLILRVAVGYIAVIPKEPQMLVNDQQQFLVLGGLPPYAWVVTQPGVGIISGSGMFTAIGPGVTQVRATDQLDQTDITRIFSVTLTRADSDDLSPLDEPVYYYFQSEINGDQLMLSLYVQDAVGVSNGFLVFNYDPEAMTLSDLERGELIAGTLFRSSLTEPGLVRVAFAAAEAIELASGKLLQFYFTLNDPDGFDPADISITEIILANGSGQILPVLPTQPLGAEISDGGVIQTFLAANYPNPFRTQTTITFAIPEKQPVELAVYDLTGRRVQTVLDQTLTPGIHSVKWDGSDDNSRPVVNGVYFYRLKTKAKTLTRRMAITRSLNK
ncbi:MAG: T9SS type A sorting domain-containing protein, partial [Planctomycetes bacterium]|nr:T9SS type A sorting domain-containing protein [Planctomycetota bacterium]